MKEEKNERMSRYDEQIMILQCTDSMRKVFDHLNGDGTGRNRKGRTK